MNKKKKYRDYKKLLADRLKKPKLALAYLNEALQNKDGKVFLIALKDVLDAQDKDISALARETHITRQNIYHMLSGKGNPQWKNLLSMCNSLGFQVQLLLREL